MTPLCTRRFSSGKTVLDGQQSISMKVAACLMVAVVPASSPGTRTNIPNSVMQVPTAATSWNKTLPFFDSQVQATCQCYGLCLGAATRRLKYAEGLFQRDILSKPLMPEFTHCCLTACKTGTCEGWT